MRRVVSAFVLATCIAIAGGTAPAARAQIAGGVAVAFRNDMKTPVIVRGCTIVNRMQKFGLAHIVLPGKTAVDNNIPPGTIRYYFVVDANQPALRYIQNLPVPVLQNDVNLVIGGVPPNVFVRKIGP